MSQTRVRIQHLTAFLRPVTSAGEPVGHAFTVPVTTTGKADMGAEGCIVSVEVIFSAPNGQITPAIEWLPVQALADGDEPYFPHPAPALIVDTRVQHAHDGRQGRIVATLRYEPHIVRVLWDGSDDPDDDEPVNVKILTAASGATV